MATPFDLHYLKASIDGIDEKNVPSYFYNIKIVLSKKHIIILW